MGWFNCGGVDRFGRLMKWSHCNSASIDIFHYKLIRSSMVRFTRWHESEVSANRVWRRSWGWAKGIAGFVCLPSTSEDLHCLLQPRIDPASRRSHEARYLRCMYMYLRLYSRTLKWWLPLGMPTSVPWLTRMV